MAELTINIEDITSALRKNLEGFKPDMSAAQVGRVLEVGDGIASVGGLPDCAVNEMLEFEKPNRFESCGTITYAVVKSRTRIGTPRMNSM